jgi:AraC family transcriptional regulator
MMKKRLSFLSLIIFLPIAVSAAVPLKDFQEAEVIIKNVQSFAYCCIHHKGPYSDIEKVIAQIFPLLSSQNIPPGGPMVGVFYNSPEEVAAQDLEWDIGFPCSAQSSPLKPLEKRVWNFMQVAAAVHKGPYEKTGETYTKIFAWMDANGYAPAGPVLEKYLSMPTPDTDPETLMAEIWVPVQKK